MIPFKPFDAVTIELRDTNLIEASAGTGKTYSIAILVLRIVLEEKLSIKEVLMVTFTKAAVAELQERIRLFIRSAYKVSKQEIITDTTITALVKKSMEKTSVDKVQQLLREAVLFLDETAVLTIHGFCQLSLTEFAFETGQLFGTDTLPDNGAVIEEEVNKYWRQQITTIPTELLANLMSNKLSRSNIITVVRQHLAGKKYYHYEKGKLYSFCAEDHEKIIRELQEIKGEEDKLRSEMLEYIKANDAEIRKRIEANGRARNMKIARFKSPSDLVKIIEESERPQYMEKVVSEVLVMCDDCARAVNKLEDHTRKLINDIYCQAINIVSSGLEEYKQRNNLLSFDDMIINLHRALNERENPGLVSSLQQKYKAVFVDEFQDTDRLQFEIFNKAFAENTILFYIGDPKQSIYAFRKADIFTYFSAKESVRHLYTMNQNFRSSENLIQAMNLFFKPRSDFDSFYFGHAQEAITYHEVQSPHPNTKGYLTKGVRPETPVTIYSLPNIAEILKDVAAQVFDLLTNRSVKIVKYDQERNIRPSDIGILVRTKKQAAAIKRILSRHSIPAVTVDDEKVLLSEEASWVLYLLEAMVTVLRANINKALLSPFTGYKPADILELDDEITLALFRKYRVKWQDDGVYAALTDFVNDFNVKRVLLHVDTENGDRIIANLFQLIELVHKVQTNKQFSPLELISWLKRGTEGMETSGDEYEQRVESDEESVKIITIHKSKGLEYNIVFAPFLDIVERKKDAFTSYRDPVTGEYISIETVAANDAQKEWSRVQNEQENRRIVYVAITRAVYKCFLYRNSHYNKSTLTVFVNELENADPLSIEKKEAPTVDPGFRFRAEENYKLANREKPVQFKLEHNNWTKMSFTMLAQKGEPASRPTAKLQQDRYDHFMFSQLPRGSKTGNFLHQIFEQVHFADEQNWSYVVDEALRQHLPKHREQYAPMMLEMLRFTIDQPINVDGHTLSLSDISNGSRIHEFEFDFPVPQYNPERLNMLTNAGVDVRVSWDRPLEGIMNGKMDLFFELAGRFYILDWKSNYLGDTLADYSVAALAVAMNENNYHLQYLIYTVAAVKYLQLRRPGFDYEQHFGGVIYLFVRGIRSGGSSGIYTNRPALKQLELLQEILEGR